MTTRTAASGYHFDICDRKPQMDSYARIRASYELPAAAITDAALGSLRFLLADVARVGFAGHGLSFSALSNSGREVHNTL